MSGNPGPGIVRKSPRKSHGVQNVNIDASTSSQGTHSEESEIEFKSNIPRPKFNVVVCGHSQLPDHVNDFGGHSVVTLKHRGATLWSLDKELNTLWHLPANVVVLFLGGNEVIYRKPSEIKKKFREIIGRIQDNLKAHVIVTLIEYRDYSKDKKPVRKAAAAKYNKVRKFLNQYLTESATAGKYRTVNIATIGCNERASDGVHLTSEGKNRLVNKWQVAVNKYCEELHKKIINASDKTPCVVQE